MKRIFYHQYEKGIDCLDGYAASWVCKKVYPDAVIAGCCYQTVPPPVDPGDEIIVVDFSFPAPVLEGWADMGCKVTIIDHHKSALNNLKDLSDRILQKFNMQECGATLAWKHYFPEKEVPVFLKYVKDQDLWQWKLPYSKEVRSAFGKLKRTFALFDKLERMNEQKFLEYMVPVGAPAVRQRERQVERIASRHIWINCAGYIVPAVWLYGSEGVLRSDVCEFLYRKYPEAPFSMTFRREHADIWKLWKFNTHYDFRSGGINANFDVSAIAQEFGGGGHKNASGAKIE